MHAMLKLSQSAVGMLVIKYRTVLKKMFLKNSAALILGGVLALSPSGGPAFAADFYVINANDSGSGSLREAILSAAAGDTIKFDASLNLQNIYLTSPININGTDKNLSFSIPDGVTVIINGTNYDGASGALLQFDYNSPVDFSGPGVLIIQNGSNDSVGTTYSAYVRGGGVYARNITHLSGSVTGNTATAQNDSGEANALGSGVYAINITNLSGAISGNTATAQNDSGYAYVYGGGVYVWHDITNLSGAISDNTAKAQSGSGKAYAEGGGVNAVNITDLSGSISSNTALAKSGSGDTEAYGGGVFALDTIDNLSGTISDNTAKAKSDSGYASASGGGLYAWNITDLSGTISNNTASATVQSGSGDAYVYGGGMVARNNINVLSGIISGNTASAQSDSGDAYVYGSGVVAWNNIDVLSGIISGNTTSAQSDSGDAQAVSGGVVAGSIDVLSGSVTGNTASAQSGSGYTSALGGGVFGDITDLSGSISSNTAKAESNSGNAYAEGGGVYAYIDNLSGTISGNTASATVQSGSGYANTAGGGVFAGSIDVLSGSVTGNIASTQSNEGNTRACGGGVNAWHVTNLSGSISGNTAKAESNSGIAYALGGGAYISEPNTTVHGGLYENNQAIATGANGSLAEGGAFFLNTAEGATTASLTLAPTASNIVFRNNTVTVNAFSQANDLHFGRANQADSTTDASLTIGGGSYNVYLLGGVTVDMNNSHNFTLTRHDDANTGNSFFWGGENSFYTDDGSSSFVTLDSGKTVLQPDFSLSGNTLDFTLGENAELLTAPGSKPAEITAASITLADGFQLGSTLNGSFSYGPALAVGENKVLLSMTATDSLTDNGTQADKTSGYFMVGPYDYTYDGLNWQAGTTSGELSYTPASSTFNHSRGGAYAVQSSLYAASANKTSAALFNRQADMFLTLDEQEKLPISYLSAPEKQDTAKKRALWFSPLYNSVRTDAQNGMARSKIKSPGFIAGYDAKISENSFIGGAVSASWPDYDAGGARTDGTDVRLSLYGGKKLNSDLELSYATSYGWGNFDQRRTFYGQTYGSSYNNNTYSLSAGVAKPFHSNEKLTIRPYAAFEYLHVKTDAYSEGSGTYALSFAKQTQNIQRLRLGVDFINENSDNYFKYGLFYLGHYGDRTASTTAFFTADPQNPFTTFGAPLDQDNLGLTFTIGRALNKVSELSLDYTALFASKGRSQNVNLNFSYKF